VNAGLPNQFLSSFFTIFSDYTSSDNTMEVEVLAQVGLVTSSMELALPLLAFSLLV
jgi:hypothetical protein